MSVKVYREGKEVEVYKTAKSNEEIDNSNTNKEMNEALEEIKEFEEEMKLQIETERMKLEEPERYEALVKENKKERFKGRLFLIWFVGSIALMLVFAGMQKAALMLSVFGHYFAVFGLMAFISNQEENLYVFEN